MIASPVEPPVKTHQTNASGKGEYLPSPEEIRAACDKIQSEWSPYERLRRSGNRERYTIPEANDPGRGRKNYS